MTAAVKRHSRWPIRRPQTVTEKTLARWASDPRIRIRISKALRKPFFPKDILISGPKGEYVHFRLENPAKFDKWGFRIKSVGDRGTRLIIGCPRGQWDSLRER